ncbi:zinc finger protein 395 [Dasypus novemcinctus]|uniref:zinc finger protein 395 n=1 Tax=Dasypus novemcinctus TaxID=9361 RepID=UPI00265FD7FE|nr:zinc finger protein 395 [Dasypus novemcinctus]
MASVLSRRLGKRSLLGARVLGPSASDGPSGTAEPEAAPQPFPVQKDGSSQEQPQEAGPQQVAFQPGQKVCVWHGGQECPGLVEQHSRAEEKVTVWLLDQKQQVCCAAGEVWLADQLAVSQAPPAAQAPPAVQGARAADRPVSRSIDVPKRSPSQEETGRGRTSGSAAFSVKDHLATVSGF